VASTTTSTSPTALGTARAPVLWRRKSARRAAWHAALYVGLSAATVAFLFPIVWTLSTSLKTPAQTFADPPVWIPDPIAWGNYPRGWTSLPFTTFLVNTLMVTLGAMVGQLSTAVVVAYGFARLRAPGRDALFGLVVATMMLPQQVTLVPQFILFTQLGWINTLWPLIVPFWFGGGAFYVFLLRQFMLTIPHDLDEAARVDGAGFLRVLFSVTLPLVKPALAAVVIFSFVAHWNDFFHPLIYLQSKDKFTLALGLRLFQTQYAIDDIEGLMAVSLIVLAPIALIFLFAQRQFIEGITLTGIKG
jgi:ABC-type glycerol-3-phosphate transport system permease component